MGLFNNRNNDPNNRTTDPNARPGIPGMPKLSQQNIVIIGLVVLAAVFLLPRLLNTAGTNDTNERGTNNDGETTAEDYNIGNIVVAPGTTSAGCASDATDTFNANDRIYLVAENSDLPANTDVFGRLYYEGEEVEDSDTITSDRAYIDSCFNIWFEDTNGFDSGQYEAQFFINGNAADTITFEVQ